MRLLVDINVVLDFALKRLPWGEDARDLFAHIERGKAAGYLAPHTVATAHYLIGRAENRQIADTAISGFLRIFDVAPVSRTGLQQALALGWRDFEDAVQAVCAEKVGADFIVTRDLKDFRGSTVPAREPSALLPLLR
jgi:predicted nucleic acid-binding protein